MKMWKRKEEIKAKEIEPREYGSDQIREIKYTRVLKSARRKSVLKKIVKQKNLKKEPLILEDEEFIIYQYPGKPVLILKREDGKLYSLKEENRQIQHQAFILLDILDDFGLVEGYDRHLVWKKKKNLLEEKK